MSGTRDAIGMRHTARLLRDRVDSAARTQGLPRDTALGQARAAATRLADLAGAAGRSSAARLGAGTPRSDGLRFDGLRADARRIVRLVDAYAGAVPLLPLHRIALRGASVGALASRMSARLDAPPGGPGPTEAAGEPVGGDWAPDGGAAHASFARVLSGTHCVFAGRSVIWTAPPPAGADIDGMCAQWAPVVRGFATACRRERLDGLLLPLPAEHGDTLARLSASVRRLLGGLVARTARSRGDLADPERPGWHLTLGGERMFVLSMAPCYPADHARHTFGEPYTFVLLQPDSAFDRAVSPGSGGLIAAAVRERIRRRYAAHGQPYDLSITLSPFEAHRFVKPLAVGDPPVRWWAADQHAERPGGSA